MTEKVNAMTSDQLDQLSINTIRTLSMDAVQQANSGHPGTPMALAPLAYTLWNRVMQFDPQDPMEVNQPRTHLSRRGRLPRGEGFPFRLVGRADLLWAANCFTNPACSTLARPALSVSIIALNSRWPTASTTAS